MEQTAFTKRRLLELLAQLEASPRHRLTVYVRPSSFPHYAIEMASELSSCRELREALGTEAVLREAQRYGTGAAIFWSEGEDNYIVIPTFQVSEDEVFRERPETSPLHQLLERERILGVVLVTWGSYGIGVLKGDKLVEAKAGTGHIHKRHRKGGSSQKRFARRTEEQKRDFLRRVANRIEEKLKGYRLEQIFFGGNRLILKPLLDECPYLRSQAQQISKRLLNVRYADRDALLGSAEDVNRSLVFSF